MAMMTRRSFWIYGVMVAIWAVLLGWQAVEHSLVRKSARAALINRSKDISDTLGLVMRSQRRFGGVISKERMESSLKDLLKPGELSAIALLNAAGEVVASGGEPRDLQLKGVDAAHLDRFGEQWDENKVTLINLVDLGTNLTQDLQITNLTLVIPRHDLTNRPPPPPTNRPPPEFESNLGAIPGPGDGTNSLAAGRGR